MTEWSRNRPTPEGFMVGTMLARWAREGEPAARLVEPTTPPMCKSCAFRQGTIPNGCPETVLDALRVIVEQNDDFYCHREFDDEGNAVHLCSGATFAMASQEAAAFRETCGGKLPFPEIEHKAELDEERRQMRAERQKRKAAR